MKQPSKVKKLMIIFVILVIAFITASRKHWERDCNEAFCYSYGYIHWGYPDDGWSIGITLSNNVDWR